MTISHKDRSRRIEDCRNIFLKYNGQHHELIEKEMRELGHTDFHRRSLYRRFERGSCKTGWIERYGWQRLLKDRARAAETRAAETRRRWDAATQGENPEELPQGSRHQIAASLRPTLSASIPNDFDAFREWLKVVSPSMNWEWRHQVYIYKRLKRVTDGLCKRLMIFSRRVMARASLSQSVIPPGA